MACVNKIVTASAFASIGLFADGDDDDDDHHRDDDTEDSVFSFIKGYWKSASTFICNTTTTDQELKIDLAKLRAHT